MALSTIIVINDSNCYWEDFNCVCDYLFDYSCDCDFYCNFDYDDDSSYDYGGWLTVTLTMWLRYYVSNFYNEFLTMTLWLCLSQNLLVNDRVAVSINNDVAVISIKKTSWN